MPQILRLSRNGIALRNHIGLNAVLLLSVSLAAGCSGDDAATGDTGPTDGATDDTGIPTDGDTSTDTKPATVPTVISNIPLSDATGVPINAYAGATFSEAMDGAKLTTKTFTVTSGTPAVALAGTVTYGSSMVAFWPAADLAKSTTFTATITTGAISAAGVALAKDYTWKFTTGDTAGPGIPVNLGTAGNFVILAKTGVSTVSPSAVTGNLGVSPAAATYITGFSLTADPSNVFSTSTQVTGKVYAATYKPPTPANLTAAVGDMETAFTSAAARAPGVTELGAGDIGGKTLAAGVYKWGTGLLIPTNVTLNGSATDVWIFQIGKDLTVASAAKVALTGGALPKNVFWQVAGKVDIGTTAHLEGVILAQTAIVLKTDASVKGRLLAQTAVTLDKSVVVEP